MDLVVFDEKEFYEKGLILLPEEDVIKDKSKLLGEGKFGKVYKGKYKEHDVAIKKMIFDTDGDIVIDEIMNEIKMLQIASTLCSEVPKFYGTWKKKKYYHLVFEFINGETLRQKLGKSFFSLDEKLYIIYQIAEVLHFLHAKRLIHRDIKPENIMVISETSKIKIIDFGTAKLATKTITFTSKAVGTTYYMAPDCFDFSSEERENDNPVGQTTALDVWSLGVMMTEILTGVFPYSQLSKNESIIESFLIQGRPFPIPSELPKKFPEFMSIVKRCLELDKNKRCSSREVMDRIRPMLTDLEEYEEK